MRKIFKITGIIAGCFIFVFVLIVGIWYVNYIPSGERYDWEDEDNEIYVPDDLVKTPSGFNHNKYFDLCIADEFFKDRTNQKYNNQTKERTQIKWDIPVEQIANNDTLTFSITNNTNDKLYYLGFQPPYYLIILDYIISPQGKIDTIKFTDWGDFEAIGVAEYIPFKKKETIILKDYNPVLLYPPFGFYLPMDTEEFPKIIKEVYGDTVQIRYGVYLRGLPWNNRGFSIAYSDFIKIPIDSIIDGWKKGMFTNRRSYIPEDHQEYLNERDRVLKRYKQR